MVNLQVSRDYRFHEVSRLLTTISLLNDTERRLSDQMLISKLEF